MSDTKPTEQPTAQPTQKQEQVMQYLKDHKVNEGMMFTVVHITNIT